MSSTRIVLIGITGLSTSGKTTLSRLLQSLYSSIPESQSNKVFQVLHIHQDDFYLPSESLPYLTLSSGEKVQDWDSLSCFDIPLFTSTLQYVKIHGNLPVSTITSDHREENQPFHKPFPISPSILSVLRNKIFSNRLEHVKNGEGNVKLVIVDGLILLS